MFELGGQTENILGLQVLRFRCDWYPFPVVTGTPLQICRDWYPSWAFTFLQDVEVLMSGTVCTHEMLISAGMLSPLVKQTLSAAVVNHSKKIGLLCFGLETTALPTS